MSVQPLENDPAADRLASRIERERERLTLTRDGEPVAVVIGASELVGIEDTLELLRTRDEAEALDEGVADIAAGRVHDAGDVLDDLRRRRGDV